MAKLVTIPRQLKKLAPNKSNITATEDAEQYLARLKSDPLDQLAYNRLMIIYRKAKEYKKEIQVINNAIRAFEAFHKKHARPATTSIRNLSKQLSRALGLTDSKGKVITDHEPIATWKRRKALLSKKIGGLLNGAQ